jgi:hypothetical protein
MKVLLSTKNLEQTLTNLTLYSLGFIEGAQSGKKIFLENLGKGTIQVLSQYIDLEARANPRSLHHVYEWYKTGSPSARLYDLQYNITGSGVSINGTFKQSKTLSNDSNVPFYNKARIMENGTPVTIKPKKGVLAFTVDGEKVFTKKTVTVQNPGGNQVQGSFENIIDQFFKIYFTQAFLRASGLTDHLENPKIYKTNLKSGIKNGKTKGVSTGFKWITSAKIEVE